LYSTDESRTRSELHLQSPDCARRLERRNWNVFYSSAVAGTEHLTVERDGATVVVTMNRPAAKNALSPAMLVGMVDAWMEIDGDDDVRCAVLTGAGGDFCTGMDLKAFARGGDANPYADRMAADPDLHWKALLRHYHLRKPLIAAVEGYAVAGGTEILQATDIRVAGESATLGVFEARRGLFPLGGSTVRLRRQLPFTIAMDILLTGRPVSAAEAKEIGLIGYVVPDGKALEKALEIAGLIAKNGPLAVEAIKRSVRETEGLPEDEALKVELEIGSPIFASEDAKEGTTAFAEKREPRYQRR
jgi:enoyl-CoA hydratase